MTKSRTVRTNSDGRLFAMLAVATVSLAVPCLGFAAETGCGSLRNASFPHIKIVSATQIAAGRRSELPAGVRASLPAFCRVVAQSTPVPGSTIGFEVWLPDQGWNGRLIGVGNGALGGVISYSQMVPLLMENVVSFSTDTGHLLSKEPNGAVAIAWAKNPEGLIDYGYRAIHEAAEGAKAITNAVYGKPAQRSYFAGCSTGGRQAASEAERYPDDFDGILMGAPALDWSSQHEAQIFEAQQTLLQPDHFLSKEKLAMVKAAATAQCDARDGAKDGLIADPRRCEFHPATLQCKTSNTAGCLSAGQVDAIEKIYAGPTNKRGEKIFYGAMPGSETEIWVNTGAMGDNDLNIVSFQLVNQTPQFQWRSMDFSEQARRSRTSVGGIIDATDTDLRAFLLHGKLLAYQGWNDPYMKPERTIAFYNSVNVLVGDRMAGETFRLFMVPNMGHCGGGDGPNEFGGAFQSARSGKDPEHNALLALEAWVEDDRAPDKIIATRFESPEGGRAVMTQPLCPYPAIARWNGNGDVRDEKNFACGPFPASVPDHADVMK